MRKTILLILILTISFFYTSSTVYADDSEKDNQVISLNGKWELYWGQLLTPTELIHNDTMPKMVTVPGSWSNLSENEPELSRFGYATYRLIVPIPQEDIGVEQGLLLNYVGSAYRIWIDGREYRGLGQVGTHKSEENIHLQKNLITFTPTSEQFEIFLQVSNFSFREGGIFRDVTYGDLEQLTNDFLREGFFRVLIIGGSLIIGLYHVLIFIIRRKEMPVLFIGLLSLALSARTFLLSEAIVSLLFTSVHWELLIKVEYLVEIALFIFLVFLYKNLFPNEVHRWGLLLSYIVAAVLSLFIIVSPIEIFTLTMPYHLPVLLAFVFYYIFIVGVLATIRKREGAILNIIAGILFISAAVNDYLVSLLVINNLYMLEIAFIFFIVIQAVIVFNRYASLLRENVRLTGDLINLNQSLEEKIEERTQKINEKNQQLVELQKTKTRLLANIAHDIGTPLAGIQTLLRLIREGNNKVDIQDSLPRILDNLSYIQRLNSDLFELSKLESHSLSFYFQQIAQSQYIQDISPALRFELQNIEVELKVEQMLSEEIYVQMDRQRINQVVQNFISNGIKFNHSEHKMITLRCYQEEIQNEVVIEVEDNGIGISPEEVPNVFERFYKKEEGNLSGSGLGLAIVKEIIQQHGGRVGVRSNLGDGCTFYFTLPIVRK